MTAINYQGKFLISQPKCESKFFEESVVLIADDSVQGAWGIIINKLVPDPDSDLADVIKHVGMDNPYNINGPLYMGGPVERNRVCILHTNDWSSENTVQVTPDLYITTDISILAAIAGGQGPKDYKVFCGLSSWAPEQLKGEMQGIPPWTQKHRWLTVDAASEAVFNLDHTEQWGILIMRAVELEVKEWF